MADKHKLLRPEAELDARPPDASGFWSGDEVDELDDQRTQRKPAEVWARHDAALTAAPEIALFGNVEVDSVSDPINLTIFNRAQTPVDLEAPTIRAGTSNDGHVPVDEFVVAKPSTTTVALGRPAMLAVAFAPKHVAGSRSTLHVTGRAGSQPVDLQVSLRGQGVKQRRDDDPNRPVHAEQREARRASWDSRGIADHHAVSATHSYAEMLTTVLAAQRLTQSGSKEDQAHARELLLAVSSRLHELAPVARERLRDFGWGHNPGVEVFDRATASIDDWVHKLGLGGNIETTHLVTAFEVGAEEIRLVTGERSDAPNLRALHEAAKLTPPAIAGAAVGGAAIGALIGSAPALAGVIGEEAGLLSFAARSGGQRLLLWGAAHPALAVELVSSFVGVGTAINSWDDFVQALQDPREAMFLLMQVAMELMHLHQARGPRAASSRAARGGSSADSAPVIEHIRELTTRVRTIAEDADHPAKLPPPTVDDYAAMYAAPTQGAAIKQAETLAKNPGTVYHHNIGRAGTRAIVQTRTLLGGEGTASFGGGTSVRAWIGAAVDSPATARTSATIEFTVDEAPDVRLYMGTPGAKWNVDELRIHIRRVLLPGGRIAVPSGGGDLTVTANDGTVSKMKIEELPE